MDPIIETASINLVDELCEIEKQSFTAEAFTKKQIRYVLGEYNSIGLVAKLNGKIAGFLIGEIDVKNGKISGHLLTLDVAPTYRRMGIAQRLLERLEELLKQKNAIECCLEVRENNAAATNLYLKLGYKRVERLQSCYGNANGLYMRKSLS